MTRSTKILITTCLMWLGVVALAAEIAGKKEDEKKASTYSPIGKRDPFRIPRFENPSRATAAAQGALEKFTLDKLTLRAILQGSSGSTALFEDPDGKTFIVNEGDPIGRERARVSKILNTGVIVTERTFNYLGKERLFERVFALTTTDDEPNRKENRGTSSAVGSGGGMPSSSMPSSNGTFNQPVQKFEAPAPAAADSKADLNLPVSPNFPSSGQGNVK